MKTILFISLTCILAMSLHAQDTNYVDPAYQAEKKEKASKKRPMQNRVYFGGTFGLQFGSVTSILVEPLVGFRMTEKLSTGIGIGVRYGKDNRYVTPVEYTNYIGRYFVRYLIIPKLYAHAEYMFESYDKVFYFEGQDPNRNQRTVVPFLFVGGGYRSQAGRGSFIIQVLFNVLQENSYSRQVYPGGLPYISIGYIGGF